MSAGMAGQSGLDIAPSPSAATATAGAEAVAIRKRSIRIAGHPTSVSLEQAFWDALKLIARARQCTVTALIAEVDRGRRGNLSSAVRVFTLQAAQALPPSEPFGQDNQPTDESLLI